LLLSLVVLGLLASLFGLLIFLFIREAESLTTPSLLANLAERTLLRCAMGDAPYLV
jgi:hypothetical protein